MLQTSNYNLNKPEGSDVVDISVLNENFDVIDTTMKTLDNRTAPYVVTSGSANTYIATINGITSYTAGMRICVQINVTSTGASTLNINGLGAKTILDSLGNTISSGGLKANIPYQLCYNGSNFIVLGKGGGGDALASQLLISKKATVDTGPIVGTMPDNGGVSSTLTNNNQEYVIPAGFHNGLGKIKAMITNLAATVIKAGTTVGGIVGTFTSDATAIAADIVNGKTAYVNGNKITGNATIESLGGRQYTSGVVNHTANTTDTITLPFIPSVIIIGFSAGAQKAAYWISNSNQTSSTTFYYLSDRSAVSGYSHTENTNTIIVTSAYSEPTYYFAWA